MLRKNHATVSVAESATGGMLGERFTSVPGSSEYFAGGFITYTDEMKMELLGVLPEIAGAVRRGEQGDRRSDGRAARAGGRTRRTRCRSRASPGRSRAPRRRRSGTMYVGIADASGSARVHRQFLGDRQRIRIFTCQMALDLLRRRITGSVTG